MNTNEQLCIRCGTHHSCYACGVVHWIEEENPNCNPGPSGHPDCDLRQIDIKHAHLARALRGEVVPSVGQIKPDEQRAINAAVKRGDLVKWRGHWYPMTGHPTYGMGPLKTCYSTHEHVEMGSGV